MTDTETVLVLIQIVHLSIFFTLCIVVMAIVVSLLSSLKRVVSKAEDVIDSVETAAETITAASGKLTIMKLISNIIKLSTKGSNKS